MFIKCFKKFTCYVLFLSMFFSFQSSPLYSMEPNEFGEVWDYDSTNRRGRYFCPPATVDNVSAYIYPAALGTCFCISGIVGGMIGICIYNKCEKSCKKRSKARYHSPDPALQGTHRLQDMGPQKRLNMNDEPDNEPGVKNSNLESNSEDNSEIREMAYEKQFSESSGVIDKTK